MESIGPSRIDTAFVAGDTMPSWQCDRRRSSALHLLDKKFFEEEGPLGKGITVGKVQVALMSPDRGKNSIFAALQDNARWVEGVDEPASLADLAHDVCLSLLRKKDYWTAAHSESVWSSANDASKAEAKYNAWSKIQKQPSLRRSIFQKARMMEGSTQVVVSLVIEIEGDSTIFDGAGFSMAGTQAVLNSIASNCLVDEGQVVNAAEIFWTPGDPKEALTSTDLIVDFPELVTL